jgi:non-heme chloroperoxidase
MGGGEVARYLGTYGSDRIARAVFAGAVPPYLHKSDDNPDGALDDATINGFQQGVTTDRIAFVDGFATTFFTAGGILKVSDNQVTYAREQAHLASPKGTLDCITAFGRTDFRGDLAKIDVPTLVIHGDSDAIVPVEHSGKRTHEAIAGSTLAVIKDGPHGINASHPAEFNEALLAFLNS